MHNYTMDCVLELRATSMPHEPCGHSQLDGLTTEESQVRTVMIISMMLMHPRLNNRRSRILQLRRTPTLTWEPTRTSNTRYTSAIQHKKCIL